MALMKALLARFASGDRWRHWPRAVCCMIWIGLAIAHLHLAVDALDAMRTRLPRAGFRVPVTHHVQIGNLRFQDVVNHLAEQFDKSATTLEQSVRRSARTSLLISLPAAFLCLMGLAAQWQIGRSKAHVERPGQLEDADARGQPELPTAEESDTELSEEVLTHDGCFPSGGYGR